MSFTIEDSLPDRHALVVDFCKGVSRTYVLIKREGSKYPYPEHGDYFCAFKDTKGKHVEPTITDQTNFILGGQSIPGVVTVKWQFNSSIDEGMRNAISVSTYGSKIENVKVIFQSCQRGNTNNVDKLDELDYIFVLLTQSRAIKESRLDAYELCQTFLIPSEKKAHKIVDSSPTINRTNGTNNTHSDHPELMRMASDDSDLLIEKEKRCQYCQRRPILCGHVYGFFMWCTYECTSIMQNACFYFCCSCCCM